MIELVRAAAELQEFCEARRWRFCFIGGLTVQMWSELRATMDVDMTLLTGFGEERPFIDALLELKEQPGLLDQLDQLRREIRGTP